MSANIFQGCIPALMTPCREDRTPDYFALVRKGRELIEQGMSAVVYCGSMGDWPLLTDAERQEGVSHLVNAGLPVIVGTGAQNTAAAADHAAHAKRAGAKGLMVIPRVLSRGTSPAAQKAHFSRVLDAADSLPSIIYNSPYYGFETRAELFFNLREQCAHLVGFKEFGGADALSYAAANITSGDDSLTLMVGVDTQVVHGFVNCGATGAITGVGNVLPREVLHLVRLSMEAADGNAQSRMYAQQLDEALRVLSNFDEGPDLVLYYKYLMVLEGSPEYEHHFNADDALSSSQRTFAANQLRLFKTWYNNWPGASSTDQDAVHRLAHRG